MDCGSGRYGKGYDGYGGSRISLANVPDFSWRCNVDLLYGAHYIDPCRRRVVGATVESQPL